MIEIEKPVQNYPRGVLVQENQHASPHHQAQRDFEASVILRHKDSASRDQTSG